MTGHEITVSLTETVQFERLVDFLGEVRRLAAARSDEELDGLVERCLADLMEQA